MTAGRAEPAPGLDRERLAAYLRGLPGAPALERVELIDGGRSNLTYSLTTSAGPLVLRRPPLGDVAPSANDVGREYRVLRALRDSAVPVPRTVALCTDSSVIGAPFSLVEKVAGRVLRHPDDVSALGTGQVRAVVESLVDHLAALHRVDVEAVGLGGLGRPAGFVARQVERWQAQREHVATRPLPAADELYRRLRRRVPADRPGSLVHGDYRLDNVMVDTADPTRIVAVLDWELTTLGDPLTDLGLLLVYREPECAPVLPHGNPFDGNPHVPTADDIARRYGEVSGRPLDDLGFYRALGCLKLAVIAEGIHRRHLAGLTVGAGFDSVGDAVEALLRRGLELVTSRSPARPPRNGRRRRRPAARPAARAPRAGPGGRRSRSPRASG
jgi:aminoglycoside phosphotransferase (APT) family kinase protein